MGAKYPVRNHIFPPKKALRLSDGKFVDISDFTPIIDHPVFQVLDEKKQTGLVHLIFRGAHHTRFFHSIATLYYAQELLRQLRIEGDLAKAISVYALVHDIGHGPFSHQTEPLLSRTHDENGLIVLEQLKKAIEETGADFYLVRELFEHSNPYYAIVLDKNLGADKLSYLYYDSYFMGFPIKIDINNLILYTVFVDGKIAQEEKNIDEVIGAQIHYADLHTRGYLRKQSLINQRIFQRAIQESMRVDGYGEKEIWGMVDADLESRLMNSESELARELFRRIRYRDTLKAAVVFRIAGFEGKERIAKKPIYVKGLPQDTIKAFMDKFDKPQKLTEFEDYLSEELGLPKGQLLIAASPFFERLIPKDVSLYSQKDERLSSLFEARPDHRQVLDNTYVGSFAIRFATPTELRERVFKLGQELEKRVLKAIEE